MMEGSILDMPDQSFSYRDCCYFAFVFSLFMHPGFLLSFPATLIPVRAILRGFNIRSVFSVSLVCMSEIVPFCALYFSVMLLELNVAIVRYTIS